MAIFRSVMRFPINGNRALDVVLEDRNPRVIFTLGEKFSDSYRTRETFELTSKAAMRLAMFLAGVGTVEDLEQIEDDEGES